MNMENYFQSLLDNIEDVAWLVDQHGHFLIVNDAFLKLYKISPEQIKGKSYFDVFEAEIAKQYQQEDQDVMASQQIRVIECEVHIQESDWCHADWIETKLSPVIDEHGQCVGVAGISRDITDRKNQIRQLQQRQKWLDIYFNSPLVGMAILGESLEWIDCNQHLLTLLAYHDDKSALRRTSLLDHISPASKDQIQTCLHSRQLPIDSEVELLTAEGQTLICDFHLKALDNDELYGNAYILSVTDVSVKRDISEKLIIADKVIESSAEAVMITDAENNIIRVNDAFSQLTGYPQNEVLGKDPKILSSGRTTTEMYKNMWLNIEQKGFWQGEIWDRRKDGSTYPKWMTISTVKHPKSGAIVNHVAMFSDVTDRKRAENKIKFLAYHDELTGLPNRILFESRLAHAVIDAEEDPTYIVLIQIDVDNFKAINDSFGHIVGDEVIKAVAGLVRKNLRATDIIARLGGDEFVVMLDKIQDKNNIETLAKKLLKAFANPVSVMNYKIHLSVSIGISIYPEDGQNHEALLQNVDIATHRAKNNGKNQYAFFNKVMSQQVLTRLKLEYQLREAIDNEDFMLFYQPQIDLQSNTISGVEALIRWKTADGFVPPTEFIPVTEETGLILPLGEWILKKACQDLAVLKDNNINVRMAVNLSAHQFGYDYLCPVVNKVIAENNVSPNDLVFEITEGALIQNTEDAKKLINHLREMGCTLAIDDFGTGYSSLAYIKEFRVNKLKIDRTFISGLPDDKSDEALTNAIIGLAESFGLTTVAEGAETAEQVQYLQDKGCDIVQGYYFAKPMPLNELMTFYSTWASKFS